MSPPGYIKPNAKDLDVLVKAYADEVRQPDSLAERSQTKAKRLFDAALGPITELDQKKTVIIVPDGSLDLVGFDSLIDHQNQYLIRSHAVSYIPSATVLHILRNRPTNSSAHYSLLAFGAPDLPNQTASENRDAVGVHRALLDMDGATISRLRAASGEVREISSELGGPSQVFLGRDATEARFKSEPLTKFRVIHFATHAFADMHHPERSAIILAPDAHTGDDGLLQIREIRNLSLRADVVTLSACDAGSGRREGLQGLASLVSAFQFAGARSVLASRWITDDTFAASLMTDIYRELGKGASVSEALHSAQLAALQKYGTAARPFLWSAFFVSGDPNTKIYATSIKPEQR